MAKTDKIRIYECISCGTCFEHIDEGPIVNGICPNGGGTKCIDITNHKIEQLKEQLKRDEGIFTKE